MSNDSTLARIVTHVSRHSKQGKSCSDLLYATLVLLSAGALVTAALSDGIVTQTNLDPKVVSPLCVSADYGINRSDLEALGIFTLTHSTYHCPKVEMPRTKSTGKSQGFS